MVVTGVAANQLDSSFGPHRQGAANQTGWVCRCGVPLDLADGAGSCVECGSMYAVDGDALRSVVTPNAGAREAPSGAMAATANEG